MNASNINGVQLALISIANLSALLQDQENLKGVEVLGRWALEGKERTLPRTSQHANVCQQSRYDNEGS